jgi:F-type H+-transporting ATPase subunit b
VLPDLSLIWVIGFVLVLAVILDRLLLRPLTRVMASRESAIHTARELAETSRARAQAATDEFEAKTRAARADVYRQMEDTRRAALERRAQLVGDTRRDVEQSVAEATTRLQAQAAAARTQLDRDADHLASSIVERVLGRKAS